MPKRVLDDVDEDALATCCSFLGVDIAEEEKTDESMLMLSLTAVRPPLMTVLGAVEMSDMDESADDVDDEAVTFASCCLSARISAFIASMLTPCFDCER